MSLRRWMFDTTGPRAAIVIRLLVGAVFVSEGVQKFLFPTELGIGRFAKIGLPSPEVLAPFVGTFEIVCGSLVLLGAITRVAAIPLLIIMLVAIATTKIPFTRAHGFWAGLHEARVDYAMLLGALFLLLVGAGPWSIDRVLSQRQRQQPTTDRRS